VKGVLLAFLTTYAELEGIICSGPRRGGKLTYALLDARATPTGRRSRDEALGTLARRYFSSHGPATVRDFVWWSGLPTADARRAIEIGRCESTICDGLTYWSLEQPIVGTFISRAVHLLPIYDEYLVAYRDLQAVPRLEGGVRGSLSESVIAAGHVVGSWTPMAVDDGVAIQVKTTRQLNAVERRALAQAAADYGRFIDQPVVLRESAR
jgi:hypothetical protein